MLNFAEQTGSGAVMLVWSFLPIDYLQMYIYYILHIINGTFCILTTYIAAFDCARGQQAGPYPGWTDNPTSGISHLKTEQYG